ncbi:MAG: VIT1/CCC1 transporter family protein [Planctomycetota bacterium]
MSDPLALPPVESDDPKHQKQLAEAHSKEGIAERLASGTQHSYLRDAIFGSIDGAVTTLAVVSGVAGAGFSDRVLIILGLANLVADGFSMAAGNYLGTKAEAELRDKARRIEHEHIDRFPDGEREEVRQIFARKGFEGADLENAVDVITSDLDRWVDTMIQDEWGLPLEGPKPWRAALTTYVAFGVAGALPLLAFLGNWIVPGMIESPFVWSAVLTGLCFFTVGVLKGRILGQASWRAGLETLLVGGVASGLAYGLGRLLDGLN